MIEGMKHEGKTTNISPQTYRLLVLCLQVTMGCWGCSWSFSVRLEVEAKVDKRGQRQVDECVHMLVCPGVVTVKVQLILASLWFTSREREERVGNVLQICALPKTWPEQMFQSCAPNFRRGECEECSDTSLYKEVLLVLTESEYQVRLAWKVVLTCSI